PQADVLNRLGQLANRLLERPKLHELALEAAQAILAVSPDDGVATAIRSAIDGFRADWQGRVQTLEQRAATLQAQDALAAADTWLSIAEIQLVYGEQTDAALGTLDRAPRQEPRRHVSSTVGGVHRRRPPGHPVAPPARGGAGRGV